MTLEMELKRRWRQGEAKGRAEGIAEGMEKGMEKGKTEGQALSALGMLKRGMDMDLVSQCTQLSLDVIKKLAKQNKLL